MGELATVLGPAITAVATIVVTVIGLVATGRARKAERSANQESAENDRLKTERQRMDDRYNRIIDELQEDNTRLRAALREREFPTSGGGAP